MEFKPAYLKGGFTFPILYSVENVFPKWNKQLLENYPVFRLQFVFWYFPKLNSKKHNLTDIGAKKDKDDSL